MGDHSNRLYLTFTLSSEEEQRNSLSLLGLFTRVRVTLLELESGHRWDREREHEGREQKWKRERERERMRASEQKRAQTELGRRAAKRVWRKCHKGSVAISRQTSERHKQRKATKNTFTKSKSSWSLCLKPFDDSKLSFWNFEHALCERADTKQWGELKNFWVFIPLGKLLLLNTKLYTAFFYHSK